MFTLRVIWFYITNTLAGMLPAIPVAIAIRLAAIPLRRRAGLHTTVWHEAGVLVLFMWVAAVLSQTVSLSSFLGHGLTLMGGSSINMVPFKTIAEMAARMDTVAVVNLLGNVAMFVPVGLLPPLLWRGADSTLAALGMGFGLSLFIETAQLFSYRSTDVDDLILNTLGALTGYGLYRLVRRAVPGLVARFRAMPAEARELET